MSDPHNPNPYEYRPNQVSQTPEPQLQKQSLDFATVFKKSFSAVRENPSVFLGLTFLNIVPILILIALWFMSGFNESVEMLDSMEQAEAKIVLIKIIVAVAVACLLTAITYLALQGSFAYSVFQTLIWNKATLPEALIYGLKRVLTLIVLAVLMYLAIFVGLLLLIVPGIILTYILAVSIPVCAVEKLGPIESMKRSAELTKDNRLMIFLIFFVAGAATNIVTQVLSVVLGFIPIPIISGLLIMFVAFIPMAFLSVITAVVYYELRSIKEGVSVESIAGVFE